MKALLLTLGTRGDTQPLAAMAKQLTDAGHEVVLGVPSSSESLVKAHNINCIPIRDNMSFLFSQREVRQLLEGKRLSVRSKVNAFAKISDSSRHVWDELQIASDGGADVVIYSAFTPGHLIAELIDAVAVAVCFQPLHISLKSHPPIFMPIQRSRIRSILHLRANIYKKAMWRIILGDKLSGWRRDALGLQPSRNPQNPFLSPDGKEVAVLQAFSSHALSDQPQYPDWVHTTGYWFLPASSNWTPSEELRNFLNHEDRPVYVGFGSFVGGDPLRTTRIISEALRKAGVRAVVATGWGGIDPAELGDNVFVIDQIPHDWLFPQMAAIVHAGGAGTTGAALASGRPQVVCPSTADQPHWASRMQACGVAPSPQPQRKLTAHRLAKAIHSAVTDKAMARRAEELGRRIRTENGVTAAAKIVESLIQSDS